MRVMPNQFVVRGGANLILRLAFEFWFEFARSLAGHVFAIRTTAEGQQGARYWSIVEFMLH